MSKYNPQIIEKKWQEIWEKDKTFSSEINHKKQKYYVLEIPFMEELWLQFMQVDQRK